MTKSYERAIRVVDPDDIPTNYLTSLSKFDLPNAILVYDFDEVAARIDNQPFRDFIDAALQHRETFLKSRFGIMVSWRYLSVMPTRPQESTHLSSRLSEK